MIFVLPLELSMTRMHVAFCKVQTTGMTAEGTSLVSSQVGEND